MRGWESPLAKPFRHERPARTIRSSPLWKTAPAVRSPDLPPASGWRGRGLGTAIVRLVAPATPSLAYASGKEFNVGAGAARLNEPVLLIRLWAVLPLARDDDALLSPRRCRGARIPPPNPEKNDLGQVVEANPRTAILAHLAPDDVRPVIKFIASRP